MMASFTVVKSEEGATTGSSNPAQTLRCLTSDLGCLTRQDGSVNLSQGDTTSIAVVYGPAEVRIAREQIDQATVEVVYRPKVGLPKPEHRKQERILRNTLEPAITAHLHPRSSISVIVQETDDLGSHLACCINAACLALLDAAVSMNFLVAAVAVAILDNGQLVLDPGRRAEAEARSVVTYVFDSMNLRVVTVAPSGPFSQAEYREGLGLAREAARSVLQFYRESVSKKLLMSQ